MSRLLFSIDRSLANEKLNKVISNPNTALPTALESLQPGSTDR